MKVDVALTPQPAEGATVKSDASEAEVWARPDPGTTLFSSGQVRDASAPEVPVTVTGTATATLTSLAAAGLGAERFHGTGNALLASLAAAGTGKETFAGVAAAALSPLAASGVGKETFSGAGQATLASLAANASGGLSYAGTGQAALSGFEAYATGTVTTGTDTGTPFSWYLPVLGVGRTRYAKPSDNIRPEKKRWVELQSFGSWL